MSSVASLPQGGHVVLFPFLSKGHTIPMLHLATLLLQRSLSITIFTTPANRSFIAQYLSNTQASIIDISFPQNIPEIPAGIESTDKLPSMSLFPSFALATIAMQEEFEQRLEALQPPVSFMVSDGFLWWTLDSAMKFNIPRLVSYGMNTYSMSMSHVVGMNRQLLHGPSDDDELFTVTDFPWIKLTRNDFEPPITDLEPKGPHFEFIVKCVISSSKSFGYLMNSFCELESLFIDYFNNHFDPKVWCVGPLCLAEEVCRVKESGVEEKTYWIQWLDEKLVQGGSVLYVAFGSQAEISTEQLKEIALGLENSKVNFMWVTGKVAEVLPEGFEERVKGIGLVVSDWVNQQEVLKHSSVKGFLSHCGWNSALESICAGVPILAWPMMAEQPLNARFVVEEIKIGLRVDTCNGSVRGFVKWEDLMKNVLELMEGGKGQEARKNVKRFADMAKKAVEHGGSSSRTLDSLIVEICKDKPIFAQTHVLDFGLEGFPSL